MPFIPSLDAMRRAPYQLHVIGAVARRVYYLSQAGTEIEEYEGSAVIRRLFSANPARIARFDGP